MDKSKHLESVIKTHQITKEESLLDKHIQKKMKLKQLLKKSMAVMFIRHLTQVLMQKYCYKHQI